MLTVFDVTEGSEESCSTSQRFAAKASWVEHWREDHTTPTPKSPSSKGTTINALFSHSTSISKMLSISDSLL